MTQSPPNKDSVVFEFSISPKQIELFFKAVDWNQNSLPISPPTIATICREGEFGTLQNLGIPLKKVLHGEQEYIFHKELVPNQQYTGKTFIKNEHVKSGSTGKLTFYLFQTNILDQNSNLYVECFSTLVVREAI